MTATLGPCPVCGGIEVVEVPINIQAGAFDGYRCESPHGPPVWNIITGSYRAKVCGYVCTREHWSLLRRKMTRSEADAFMEGEMEYASNGGREADKVKAMIIAALTGEKT